MKRKPQVYLLYGDVVNSRGIKKRDVFEKKLQQALSMLKKQFEGRIIGDVERWKGLDEVAIVVVHPVYAIEILDFLNAQIRPYAIRIVVAKGEISALPEKNAKLSKLDGDVFIKASGMMQELKEVKQFFGCNTGQQVTDDMFTNHYRLLQLLKQGWTDKQWEMYEYYLQKNVSQVDLAKKFGVSQQSASKTLKVINADMVIKIEQGFKAWSLATYKNL